MLDAFKQFTGQAEWPAEISHLRGKVLRRKKDGSEYRIERPSGETMGGKPCAYLAPVGFSEGCRSHWKTYVKILKEMEVRV